MSPRRKLLPAAGWRKRLQVVDRIELAADPHLQ
jgi:hypothetical protein